MDRIFEALASSTRRQILAYLSAQELTAGEIANRFDMSLNRGADAQLDARACDCCQTAVAMTARGPLLAYRDRSDDAGRAIWNRFYDTLPAPDTVSRKARLRVA